MTKKQQAIALLHSNKHKQIETLSTIERNNAVKSYGFRWDIKTQKWISIWALIFVPLSE